MRHFDAWVVRDPYSIYHYYPTGRRWQDAVRALIQERQICAPATESRDAGPIDLAGPMAAQGSSNLLQRLPPEIRQMIWGYVFGDGAVHLVQLKGKIRHVRCEHATPSITQHRHCCPRTPARWREYSGRESGHSDGLLYPHTHEQLPSSLSDSGAALLRTCRAIYAEAADQLYANAVFDVDDLHTFVAFARAVGPRRLRSIRRLTVQWTPVWKPLAGQCHARSIYAHTHSDALWMQFWARVASLPNLRELRLSLDLGRFTGTISGGGAVVVAGQRLPLALAEPWLVPLLSVRGLQQFDLAVTARCDPAAKGLIEPDLCRDAVDLRDQLRAVLCSKPGQAVPLVKGLGVPEICAMDDLRTQTPRRARPRLAITAA
ncbi:hypothetical protein N7474_008145 [Penicillium riverlandense]|uniref:uncharacterized protein n=1 Tax=Penicillium riverlandense TaxID=1903569 RepID=UPI0025479F40|nr:uncharacterized protein N7474_008145 [Penicillium riverlandense]KAJ5811844.1 hypothetical protein N7474_008145 [Penicillium riverlandense]